MSRIGDTGCFLKKVTFLSLPDTEETALKLRSVGEKLKRVKFEIPASGN